MKALVFAVVLMVLAKANNEIVSLMTLTIVGAWGFVQIMRGY